MRSEKLRLLLQIRLYVETLPESLYEDARKEG
jgi:hypothetical protein